MEVFNPSTDDVKAYRHVIMQHGSGYDNDGYYVYSMQDGEGLGQFFGSLLKTAIPVLGRAIKGVSQIAKPHLQKAAADIVTAGSKRAIDKLSSDIVTRIETPTKRRRRRI